VPWGWLVVLALAAAGVGWWRWSAARGPLVPVHHAQRGPIVQTVVASGYVEPPAELAVAALVSGRVVAVAADEGDRVAAGAPLVVLDDAEAAAALAQAEAAVAEAQAALGTLAELDARIAAAAERRTRAALDQARADWERTRRLSATGAESAARADAARAALVAARSEHEAARAQVRGAGDEGARRAAAEAALRRAEAARDLAAVRRAQTRLLAPADGVVLARAVEPGDVVQPAAALLVLARDGERRIVIEPAERALAEVAPGQPARAVADAFPDQPFDAVVDTIAPSVDRARGTIAVRLRIPTPPAFLRPDMTTSVEIVVARRDDALYVPAAAVRDRHGAAPWVLVASGGRAERRPVVLGVRGEGHVEVVSGLGLDDAFVLPEESAVAEGDALRPRAADAPAPPRAGGGPT
jgi:HlyD family secretion protein